MKFKQCIKLFLTMFKIGLFTFGGGYAMIPLIESELVSKKKWLEEGEFTDMIAIAESTPGPVAINSATYAGYKIAGFGGSFFATLGVVLPSLIIIYVISLFFNQFLAIEWVNNAFKGIRACVVFLILSAGIKMLLHMKKSVFNLIVFPITLLCVIGFSLFDINFSTIFYILIGAFASVTVYLSANAKNKKQAQALTAANTADTKQNAENNANENSTEQNAENNSNENGAEEDRK